VKHVIAIIRPHLAQEVLAALKRAPIEALTVTEVKGYGRQKTYLDEYQDTEFGDAFLPKIEVSLYVDEERCDEIVQRIASVARSGRIGDGKILIQPVGDFR